MQSLKITHVIVLCITSPNWHSLTTDSLSVCFCCFFSIDFHLSLHSWQWILFFFSKILRNSNNCYPKSIIDQKCVHFFFQMIFVTFLCFYCALCTYISALDILSLKQISTKTLNDVFSLSLSLSFWVAPGRKCDKIKRIEFITLNRFVGYFAIHVNFYNSKCAVYTKTKL